MRVAKPRSPILTEPVGPVMKMLSHLRSRWMMGGVRVWRKWRPFRICRHQLRSTLGFITLNLFRYLRAGRGASSRCVGPQNVTPPFPPTHVLRVPDVISSVTRTMHFLPLSVDSHES